MTVKTLGGLERGLEVLEAITVRAPVSGAEIAVALDLDRSALQRVLTTLWQSGWIEQDADTREWRAGPRAFSFASGLDTTRHLVELAHPRLVELRDASGETAFLAVPRGDHTVVVDVVESAHLVRIAPTVGATIDAELSAAVLAIAAFLPVEDRARLLAGSVDARTEREIAGTRRRGYSINEGAVHAAAASVAAAVTDPTGRAIAALIITMPRDRASRAALRSAAAMIVDAAATLSRPAHR